MCATCGCSDDAAPKITDLDSGRTVSLASHDHSHDGGAHHDHGSGDHHDHGVGHGHPHSQGFSHQDGHSEDRQSSRILVLEQDVLAKNEALAGRNRGWLAARGIAAVNVMSSPGAGKTTLLVRTINDLGDDLPISVIEGDQETLLDGERIRATGCRVVQINTGSGCHLDADMLARGLTTLEPPDASLVMIENVGNLVCPALFDLGERARIVIMSVTEGEDKPLKYPHMFRSAQLMIINKIDLNPYVDFSVDRCVGYARTLNPDLQAITVSATRGDGLRDWYDWLRKQL